MSVEETIAALDRGEVRVAEKVGGEWRVNEDAKAAILEYFRIRKVEPLARALKPFRAWINGRKRFQANGLYTALIVSVYMPKHGGAEWLRSIQEAHPQTPVIAISGQFRPGLSAAGATAQKLRVRQVVAKPLARQELLESVRGIIRS